MGATNHSTTIGKSVIDLIKDVIHKQDYVLALEIIKTSFKLQESVQLKSELMLMRSTCYVGLHDYNHALYSVNTCIAFNSLDKEKTVERTAQIYELRSKVLEALGMNATSISGNYTQCET